MYDNTDYEIDAIRGATRQARFEKQSLCLMHDKRCDSCEGKDERGESCEYYKKEVVKNG